MLSVQFGMLRTCETKTAATDVNVTSCLYYFLTLTIAY